MDKPEQESGKVVKDISQFKPKAIITTQYKRISRMQVLDEEHIVVMGERKSTKGVYKIEIINIFTKEIVAMLPVWPVGMCKLSGNKLATTLPIYQSSVIKIWNLDNIKCEASISYGGRYAGDYPRQLLFLPENKIVGLRSPEQKSCSSGWIGIFDLDSKRQIKRLSDRRIGGGSMVFLEDGNLFVSGEGKVTIWDLNSGKCLFYENNSTLSGLCAHSLISFPNNQLAGLYRGKQVKVIDVESRKVIHTLPTACYAMQLNKLLDRYLIATGQRNVIQIWDINTWESIYEIPYAPTGDGTCNHRWCSAADIVANRFLVCGFHDRDDLHVFDLMQLPKLHDAIKANTKKALTMLISTPGVKKDPVVGNNKMSLTLIVEWREFPKEHNVRITSVLTDNNQSRQLHSAITKEDVSTPNPYRFWLKKSFGKLKAILTSNGFKQQSSQWNKSVYVVEISSYHEAMVRLQTVLQHSDKNEILKSIPEAVQAVDKLMLQMKEVAKGRRDMAKEFPIQKYWQEEAALLQKKKFYIFEGGGVKGLAYLGALYELIFNYKIDANKLEKTCGTSAGALTALLFGLGYPIKTIGSTKGLFDIMKSLNLLDLLDNEDGYRDIFIGLKLYLEDKGLTMDSLTEAAGLIFYYLAEEIHDLIGKDDEFFKWLKAKIDDLQEWFFYDKVLGAVGGGVKKIANPFVTVTSIFDAVGKLFKKGAKKIFTKNLIGISKKDLQKICRIISNIAYAFVEDKKLIEAIKSHALDLDLKQTLDKLIKQFKTHYGLFSGTALRNWVDKKIKKRTGIKNATFKELHDYTLKHKDLGIKDIYFILFDANTERTEVFSYDTTPSAGVADAAVASMSIPIIFVPREIWVKVGTKYKPLSEVDVSQQNAYKKVWRLRRHIFFDGGLGRNYPLTLFDMAQYCPGSTKPKGYMRECNEATLGFNLATSAEISAYTKQVPAMEEIDNFVAYCFSIAEGMYRQQYQEIWSPDNLERTIFLDNLGISPVSFELDEDQKEALIQSGKDHLLISLIRIMGTAHERLFVAARCNNLHEVKKALVAGGLLTVTGKQKRAYGWNALHWAAYYGNNAIVGAILDVPGNLEDINAQTAKPHSPELYKSIGSQTALHIAYQHGHVHTVELLIKGYGARNDRDSYDNSLEFKT